MWILFIIIVMALMGFALYRRRQRYVRIRTKIYDFEKRFELLESAIRGIIDKASTVEDDSKARPVNYCNEEAKANPHVA